MYEEKLAQQEEEHETEIAEQNESYLKKIAQLTEMMDTLHKKFEDEKRNKIEAEKLKGRSDNDAG